MTTHALRVDVNDVFSAIVAAVGQERVLELVPVELTEREGWGRAVRVLGLPPTRLVVRRETTATLIVSEMSAHAALALAAAAFFDEATSIEPHPTLFLRDLLADLGEALHGAGDARVRALRAGEPMVAPTAAGSGTVLAGGDDAPMTPNTTGVRAVVTESDASDADELQSAKEG